MAAKAPIPNMPGFYWVYPGNEDMHGFRARHAYNPNTGASLSLRAANEVKNGQMGLEQALIYAAHPRKVETKQMKGHTYRIVHFNTIYGATRYASTRQNRHPMVLLGYGKTTKKYLDTEPDEYWRTIHNNADASFYVGRQPLEEAYARFNQSMKEPSKSPTFSLVERIDM